ncbi:MAG: stage III sporulation protein AB [Lachnospiraceae bacterium]|nr:stage III sporulation protein AB [Lachnospiraceae bacterium]
MTGYLKIIGVVLVIVSGAGLGSCPVHKMAHRVQEMEELYYCLLRLKSEICHAVKTLPEALKSAAECGKEKRSGVYKDAMCLIAKRMEEGQSAYAVLLKKAADEAFRGSVLTEEEKDAFMQTFLSLGGADRQKQIQALEYYAETVRLAINEEKQKKKERAYLYRSLGILGGIFLSVLLY